MKDIIREIEKHRGSKVITYITSDRQGPLSAKIARDIVPVFNRHLKSIGKQDKIDLFLYSLGGDTMVPWRLVSVLREYCNEFSVLIPYKAHSAATMISLGADNIFMSPLSELSPIDPSTTNVFNPKQQKNSRERIAISVEDVMAYFDLAKNKFGIKNEEELSKVFLKFIDADPSIHPLALGNVNRIHNLIRILAKRLLASHRDPISEDKQNKIVDFLTEKLYSHQYYIGRKEAREDIGLTNVQYTDDKLAELMDKLYESYKEEMGLGKNWNPEIEIGANNSITNKEYSLALIENSDFRNVFKVYFEYKRGQISTAPNTPPQDKVMWRVINQGWE